MREADKLEAVCERFVEVARSDLTPPRPSHGGQGRRARRSLTGPVDRASPGVLTEFVRSWPSVRSSRQFCRASPDDPRSLADRAIARGSARKPHTISIVAWILLGLIECFIGSKMVNKGGEGIVLDVLLGVIGAVVGGFLFAQFGLRGVSGLDRWSLLVAVVGAVVVRVLWHTIRRRVRG